MKNIVTLLFAFIISLTLSAQVTTFEKAPTLAENPAISMNRDTFNLQFQFPCTAFIGEYGVESDGQYIYVSQWRDDSIAKYDLYGNVVETFTIPGVAYVRDLAWDGTYFYGSPNAYKFYVMDFENKVVIDTVHTAMSIRGIAYDSDDDALWISEYWSPNFYKLDKTTGATLDTLIPSGITLTAISGLAYDNYSPGGPWLWGFSQDSTGAIIIKYDIPNQAQTGNMIDVSGLTGNAAYAGGLFIEPLAAYNGVSLGGMIQNDQIFGLELGYANALVGIHDNDAVKISIYPNPVEDQLKFQLDIQGKISVKVINQLGQVVISQELMVAKGTQASISTSTLEDGVYFLQISNNAGYNAHASFIK